MKFLTLSLILLACPALVSANGCWNPHTQTWQWCPENPYADAPRNLYGAGSALGQSNAQMASDLGWQRLEQQRLTMEAGIAAQRQLRELRQLRKTLEQIRNSNTDQ